MRIGDTVDPPETLMQVIRGIASVLSKRELWPILLAAPLLYTPGQILIGLWAMPYLGDVHGLPALQRSYCLVSMVAGMSVGPLIYGVIDRRHAARWQVVTGGSLLVAAAFLALALAGQAHWLLATALCALICGGSTFFLLLLLHAQTLFRPSYSGRVVSAIGMISLAGVFAIQSISAVILGWFPAEGMVATMTGYRVLFGLMALASVAVALLCLRLRPRL
jgi:predicted MFS family arabinose efflux permease